MNYQTIALLAIITTCMAGCGTKYNALTIVDNSLELAGCQNQLVLASDRGELGQYNYPPNGTGAYECFTRSGSGSKQWVLKNWGVPDRSYTERGVEYLIYEKRSKSAPNYHMQYLGGERPVKLGYRNGKLIYIAAFFRNCPPYMKGPVYILPK